MKSRFFYLLLLSLIILVLACNDEETDLTPEITDVEAINHSTGSDTIARGEQVAVDFDAYSRSDARLDYYHIEIHDHPESGLVTDEYKIIDSSFTEVATFSGLKNSHVHQHITVPDTANLGSYHVVVVVVDQDGYSADTEELETHIVIVE